MSDWITRLERVTQRTKSQFGHLTNEQLHWKPNTDTWSIAQNLDHLIVVNETYFPVLDSLKRGTYKTPPLARFGFIVSFLGKNVLKAVQPDRRKRMKTFPIWTPMASERKEDILKDFENHQNKLCLEIEDAQVLVNEGAVIASPANRNIVYKLETAFEIIVTHEERHLEQATEVLALLTTIYTAG